MKNNPITNYALLLIFTCISYSATAQDNPYIAWAEKEYPIAYDNIKDLVDSVWGSDDPARNKYIIELQCRSLNIILTEMGKETADWDLLVKALDKWSRADVSERGENWWDWPDTNWMKVESEYKILLATKEDE